MSNCTNYAGNQPKNVYFDPQNLPTYFIPSIKHLDFFSSNDFTKEPRTMKFLVWKILR